MARERIIALDVDGVVVDLSKDWYNYLNSIAPEANLKFDEVVKFYDFHIPFSRFITQQEAYHFWKQEHIYDKAEPVLGAVEVINTLKNEFGFKIVFSTHVEGAHSRGKFLFLNKFFPVDGYNATREKQFTRCGYFVDDRHKHLNSMPDDVLCIKFDTPHHQEENLNSRCSVAGSWSDVLKIVVSDL